MILGGRAGAGVVGAVGRGAKGKRRKAPDHKPCYYTFFLCCFGASCGIAAYSLAAHWKISIGSLDIIFGFTLGAFWWPSYCCLRQNYVVVSLLLIRDRSGPPGRT